MLDDTNKSLIDVNNDNKLELNLKSNDITSDNFQETILVGNKEGEFGPQEYDNFNEKIKELREYEEKIEEEFLKELNEEIKIATADLKKLESDKEKIEDMKKRVILDKKLLLENYEKSNE